MGSFSSTSWKRSPGWPFQKEIDGADKWNIVKENRRGWLVAAAAATTTQPKNREVVVVGALVNVNSSRTMDSELSSQFVGIRLHLWMFFVSFLLF